MNAGGLEDYYETRFESGYMSFWSPLQRRRVEDTIRQASLPNVGAALDFGCGQGVMTEVLADSLGAGWTVTGTDISKLALRFAAHRLPGSTFLSLEDIRSTGQGFELVFTHHVLEHVEDLQATLLIVDGLVQPGGFVLHALPCGNPQSLEWKMVRSVTGGLEHERGNRFFFEEEGHLRRLSSDELVGFQEHLGYDLSLARFGGQTWGSIEWITASDPRLILSMTPVSQAKSLSDALQLLRLRVMLLFLNMLRLPWVLYRRQKQGANLSSGQRLVTRLSGFLRPVSAPFNAAVERRAVREWRECSGLSHGSEMYLLFRKRSGA
jgi:SAM-dependent methyltransferase